jgi:alkanesulfonate monooxygenase SsuD/methylene tetrahydromethanopterin reductase-like flavin-dependent oxidoreductase (luciferase family)
MDFHAFMYVTIGRRHELERGMAGKDPVLYGRMLAEIAEYARICDATGWSGIGIPEHHLQVEGFELGQDPGLMAMFLGQHGPRLRINQFGYVLPTHNPLRVAEHAATLDHLLGGRLNVAFVRGYQARWFENYAAVRGVRSTGPWNRKSDEDAMNRELFEECVAIIKTAWTHDTFSFQGKYWSFPQPDQRQPHEHPVYLKYGRGVDRDGAIREVGIAPRPLQNPIPVYSGFTHSLQTSLYWAREGGKPIVMASEMDFCEMLWSRYLVLADTKSEAEAWAEDCLWMWDSWSVPFGQDRPPLLIGDADTVTRMIENAASHVPFNEMFLLFGQGILEPDRCRKTLELFAEKVIPRFR